MKRIEDIKEFEDIDTYYDISNIVAEVFQDRVEAYKHLVTANKEIEKLNNTIEYLLKFIEDMLDEEAISNIFDMTTKEFINYIKSKLKGSDKNE